MTRKELLYNNILALLQVITEGAGFDTYLGTQDSVKQERLIGLSEEIRLERSHLLTASQVGDFYSDYSPLSALLNALAEEYPDYTVIRKSELFTLLEVLQKITSEFGESGMNLDEEVNVEIFGITETSCNASVENFIYINPVSEENSILFFNIENRAQFQTFINGISSNIGFFFYLLNHLCAPAVPLTSNKYVLVRANIISNRKMVAATLNLHLVINGETVHTPYVYTAKPIKVSEPQIIAGSSYQQFNDSINILSEYNYQNDILDKYLRIYHVVENFMFKKPLVELERQFPGQVFSIRDFQRMYSKIDKSESSVLGEFIESVFNITHSSGGSFGNYVLTKWKALIPIVTTAVATPITTPTATGTPPVTPLISDANCNQLIKLLNIYTGNQKPITCAELDNGTFEFKHFFPKLIYQYRNAIVHNRETEFHLTHANLLTHPTINDTAKLVLELFLIPILEEIVFHLIVQNNPVVWYNGDTLTLWER